MENEIKKMCNYYKLPIGKLSYTDDNIIQMKTANEDIIGLSSILNHFHDKIEIKNKNSENYFLEKQYFDFANIFLRSTSKKDKYAACVELNLALQSRSFLVGQNLSLADIVVFYAISDVMKQLSPIEKESYLNLSRWYDYFQQQKEVRQSGSEINFTSLHLLGWNTRAVH